MDWRRAKRVLIVAFLLLDVFLFVEWRRNLPSSQLPGTTSARPVLPMAAGVEPLSAGPLPMIRLTPMTSARIAQATLGPGAQLAGPGRFRDGAGVVTVMDPRTIVYSGTWGTLKAGATQRAIASEIQAFLIHLHLPVALGPLTVTRIGAGYSGTDTETWHAIPILGTGVTVAVSADGTVTGARFRLLVPQASGPPRTLLPAFQAIGLWEASAPTQGAPSIVSVHLAYQIPAGNGQSFRLAPSWVVTLSDGETVAINAYTGVSQH